ncbi:Hypp9681 [Branchiostoma lanceolatum]|uniref:Hypp9681 protein n=1 Tax=Branchiostoma lanceolatum TaxID=7740 RepID=A0A8S4MNQ3_BRALA|nr:Hypp9681 [Branchiostoma lanceolatum]
MSALYFKGSGESESERRTDENGGGKADYAYKVGHGRTRAPLDIPAGPGSSCRPARMRQASHRGRGTDRPDCSPQGHGVGSVLATAPGTASDTPVTGLTRSVARRGRRPDRSQTTSVYGPGGHRPTERRPPAYSHGGKRPRL